MKILTTTDIDKQLNNYSWEIISMKMSNDPFPHICEILYQMNDSIHDTPPTVLFERAFNEDSTPATDFWDVTFTPNPTSPKPQIFLSHIELLLFAHKLEELQAQTAN